MKALITLGCLSFSTLVLAATDSPPVEDYHYGQRLDIRRVVQSPDLGFCGIREVEMLYEDSAGQLHRLRYPVWGLFCGNDN